MQCVNIESACPRDARRVQEGQSDTIVLAMLVRDHRITKLTLVRSKWLMQQFHRSATQPHQIKNADDDQQGDEDAAQGVPQAKGQQVLRGSRELYHCAMPSWTPGLPGRAAPVSASVAAAAAATVAAVTRQPSGRPCTCRPRPCAAPSHGNGSQGAGSRQGQPTCSVLHSESQPSPTSTAPAGWKATRRSALTAFQTHAHAGLLRLCKLTAELALAINSRWQEALQDYSHKESSAAHPRCTAGRPALPSRLSGCAPPA